MIVKIFLKNLRTDQVWKGMCINENDSKTVIFVMRIKSAYRVLPWPEFLLGSWVISSNSHQVGTDEKTKVREGR